MIKNVIFDLGNVLLNFRPADYLNNKNYTEDFTAKVLADIFHTKEWLLLDNGDISLKEAINSISKRSSLSEDEIARIFDFRVDMMIPLDQNVKILPELKKQGYKLYYLSNFPIDIFHEIKSRYHFFNYFDGGIISAEVRHSKPEKKFYEILLEKYSLSPGECLFIDDLEINVNSAHSIGMKGLVTYGSLEISEEVKNALSEFL